MNTNQIAIVEGDVEFLRMKHDGFDYAIAKLRVDGLTLQRNSSLFLELLFLGESALFCFFVFRFVLCTGIVLCIHVKEFIHTNQTEFTAVKISKPGTYGTSAIIIASFGFG